jgi:sugar transferase (PEP-CTERM/EpsH1 system associated)
MPAMQARASGLDTAPTSERPLIAHVIFRLDVGGLENGLVNLINNMPESAYRHAIVCVQDATDFRKRVKRPDVRIITLNKRPGHDLGVYARAWKVFRELRPQIVHTRNIAALEMQIPAALAGVPCRVHSEHGRDGRDIRGDHRAYNAIRKGMRPFVHQTIAMSRNLERWLKDTIGVSPARLHQVYSGVDIDRFAPRSNDSQWPGPPEFLAGAELVIGAVGRMVPIKDHRTLCRAFASLVQATGSDRLRLVIVGGGQCRDECLGILQAAGVAHLAWLPGDRNDVADVLRFLDVFCLTSLNEGINNTILEAMATGLPVIATDTGGNPELVADGRTGQLVPVGDADALAEAIGRYVHDPVLRRAHGQAARVAVEREFSLQAMVQRYTDIYDAVLGRKREASASDAALNARGR